MFWTNSRTSGWIGWETCITKQWWMEINGVVIMVSNEEMNLVLNTPMFHLSDWEQHNGEAKKEQEWVMKRERESVFCVLASWRDGRKITRCLHLRRCTCLVFSYGDQYICSGINNCAIPPHPDVNCRLSFHLIFINWLLTICSMSNHLTSKEFTAVCIPMITDNGSICV